MSTESRLQCRRPTGEAAALQWTPGVVGEGWRRRRGCTAVRTGRVSGTLCLNSQEGFHAHPASLFPSFLCLHGQ